VKIELNPVKWFGSKSGDASAAPVAAGVVVADPAAVQVQEVSSSAEAVEKVMATVAVVPVAQKNGFLRFIDAVGSFFVHVAPVAEQVAVAAEPFLALTPFGPEYDLVVNAVVGIQKTATASIAAGVDLTGAQKMALVIQSVTPGLNTILSSKGVSTDTEAVIANWTQVVYDLLTGPVVSAAVAAAAVKQAGTAAA
jgi:hypothetical protein